MTVDINKDGAMTIKAETEIEAFALKKWTEQYLNDKNTCANIGFDWSLIDKKSNP